MFAFFKLKVKPTVLLILSLVVFTFSQNSIRSQTKEYSEDFFYIEGLRQYNIGSLDEALKIFKAMAAKGTRNDAVFYYISNIYIQKKDLKKSEEAIKTASEMDPSNVWYASQLAKIYRAQNDIDNATKVYEDIKNKNPQKVELYEELLDIYMQKKDLEKARQLIDEIESVLGRNEATGLTRYNLLIFENKPQEAHKFLEQLDKESATPRTSTMMGDYFSGLQNDTTAMAYYNKALAMDPTYMPASFGQAEIYRVKGKFDLYFERMYPFLASTDVDAEMKVNYITQILSNQKFVSTFRQQIDTMMTSLYSAHQKDTSVIYLYTAYLVQTGRKDEGLSILEDNIKNSPDVRDAHRQYLSLIYYLQDWKTLAERSDSALVYFPLDPAFLELKGISLMQLNRIPESIEIFKQLLKLSKTDSASTVRNLAILGDLYYQAGNKKEAFNHYKKTLKLDPGNISTLNNYAYYLCEDGRDLKRAYKMSKITIEKEPDNATYLDTYAWILHLLGKDIEAKAILKHAMIYGASEDADILDHYAEILYSLKEYDLAFIYWNQADKIDPSLKIAEKIAKRKKAAK